MEVVELVRSAKQKQKDSGECAKHSGWGLVVKYKIP